MNKKLLVAAACLILFLSIGFTAKGASFLEDIRAYLNKGIKITLNGAPWQPKVGDAVLYPITYEGSTYLPVRAVAEALDIPIEWDAENYTIHIGGTSELIPILSEPHGRFSATITNHEQDRLLQGEDHGQVVWFENVLHSTSRFQLEPAGQYAQLVLRLGIEGDDTRITLVDSNTTSVIHTVLVTEEDGMIEIESDITGIQKLFIEVMTEAPNSNSTVRIIAKDSYYTNAP